MWSWLIDIHKDQASFLQGKYLKGYIWKIINYSQIKETPANNFWVTSRIQDDLL